MSEEKINLPRRTIQAETGPVQPLTKPRRAPVQADTGTVQPLPKPRRFPVQAETSPVVTGMNIAPQDPSSEGFSIPASKLYVGSGFSWEDAKPIIAEALEGKCFIKPQTSQMVTLEQEISQENVALELTTSGSTGKPQTIKLSKEALKASHRMVEKFFGNPENPQWLLALSPDKIAGMSILIRSYLSGTTPTIMEDLPKFSVDKFCEAVSRIPEGHRRVSIVPTQLAKLLDSDSGVVALRSFDAILVGGAPTEQALKDKVQVLGLNVFYTYGMTETAGGCVYNGKALPGVKMSLSDKGRIVLAGPMLANGFAPAIETKDKGTISKDGILTVTGRVGDVINSGGLKVSAQEVTEKIKTLPGVDDAYVIGVNDKLWGQRMVAFVTGNTSEAQVRDVTEPLGKAAVPKQVHFLNNIPYLENGKPDRQKLARIHTQNKPKPTLGQWLEGARLRTFPLALSPIIAGTAAAMAIGQDHWSWKMGFLCFLVALFLQIGVNYSNDYSDGIRGTDDDRVGPLRLTGSGIATPEQVKTAAFVSFGIACVVGLFVLYFSGAWWLLILGVLSVAAAWGYTGGKNPYGYRGLGEVFVFIFFGLVATLGTEYVQAGRISLFGLTLSIAVGCFACAVLVANNLRDVHTDKVSGKNTLAVRIGEHDTRMLYVVLMLLPYILIVPYVWMDSNLLFVYLSLPFIWPPCRTVMRGAKGLNLIPILKVTGFISVGFAVLAAISKAGVV